jgi:hypothetical protein
MKRVSAADGRDYWEVEEVLETSCKEKSVKI